MTEYEDIPKEQIKSLRKDAFRQSKKIRLWSALSIFAAVLLASGVSPGVFPDRRDTAGSIVLGSLLAASLGAIFWKAVVDPQVRRAVERIVRKQSKEN